MIPQKDQRVLEEPLTVCVSARESVWSHRCFQLLISACFNASDIVRLSALPTTVVREDEVEATGKEKMKPPNDQESKN